MLVFFPNGLSGLGWAKQVSHTDARLKDLGRLEPLSQGNSWEGARKQNSRESSWLAYGM